MDEILSRPVPRPLNARVHLANPRRLLVGAGIGSVILLVLGAALVVLTGLQRADFDVHHFMVFAFFGLLVGVVPLWQLLNYWRARRLLRYGTIVPATLSFGTPTRGHPLPPIRATFTWNGKHRSCDFFADPGFSLNQGAVVLVLGADACVYVSGMGVIAARVR